MNVTARRAASPYARRLARERGLALASVSARAPAAASSLPTSKRSCPPPAKARISAGARGGFRFCHGGRLREIAKAAGGVRRGGEFPSTLDDLLVRAAPRPRGRGAAQCRRRLGDVRSAPSGWRGETGGGGRPPGNRARRCAQGARQRVARSADGGLGRTPKNSRQHVRPAGCLSGASVRSASGPPPCLCWPDMPCASSSRRPIPATRPTACSASMPGLVGEDDAAAFLARFRDSLETPLRLLA